LSETSDIGTSGARLADSSGGKVEYLVAVRFDLCEQVTATRMGPVMPELGQHMSKDVALRDSPIYVRDDDLGRVVPQEDLALDAGGALHVARH